jgi:hypothetical protein
VFKKRESAVRNSAEETSLLLSSRRPTITEWKAWLKKIKHFFLSPPKLPPCQGNSPENFAITRDRKANRPFISALVYGKSISGLLDTGACHSVIGSKGIPFIDSLGVSVQVPLVSKLATVDATIHTVSGVMYLPIEIDSHIREVPFYLVPSFPNDFIFGSDFFDLFSLSVRKKDNKWLVEISNHQISSIDNTGTDQSNSKTYGLAPLTDDQSKIAKDLLTHLEQLNANRPLGLTDKIEHSIDTGDAKPFKTRQYPMSPYVLNILKKKLNKMREQR